MKNWTFYRFLHARGATIKSLCAQIGSAHSHVCEVLNNKPGHGHQTRRKLFAVLKFSEIEALGWTADFYEWAAKQPRDENDESDQNVPCGTSSQQAEPAPL